MRKKLPIVLEREEVELLKAFPNTKCPTGLRNRAIIEIMHRAGLRVGEVSALKPIHVKLTGRQPRIEVKNGKGGKDRNVPIDSNLIGWLQAWTEKRPKRARYFFTTLKGTKLSIRYIQAMVTRLRERAGIEQKVTPHVLRHSYATELLEDGFTITEVQQLLGHSSVATTGVYLHVRPGDLAEKIRNRERDRTGGEHILKAIASLPTEKLQALRDILHDVV